MSENPGTISEEWPYSLIRALELEYWGKTEDPLDMLDDMGNFEIAMALCRLTPREKKILRLRYIGEMTREEIGKVFGFTRERAKQIEEKSLGRIRNNSDARYIILNGAKAYIEKRIRDGIETGLKARRDELERQYEERLNELEKDFEDKRLREETDERARAMAATIDSLNLSVRSYNCLNRAFCKTVADFVRKYPTYDDAIRIRNLGRKCLEEISEKIRDLGIEWPDVH